MSNLSDFNISNGVLRGYNGSGGDIVIPDGVTAIGQNAFGTYFKSAPVTSVVIPEGVTSIGGEAFYRCKTLKSVTLPSTLTHIYANAFYQCEALEDINLPEGLKIIGPNAFQYCSALEKVILPESLTELHRGSFYSCKALKDIVIPGGVKTVGQSAFGQCEALTSVVIGEGIAAIEREAFFPCRSLTSVSLPQSLKSIGMSAFSHCASLKEIVIPEGVEEIGPLAFNNTEVSLFDENGLFIFRGVLLGVKEQEHIEIPEGVTEIAAYTFYKLKNVHTVSLPSTLQKIAQRAFCECEGLKEVSIPDSVTEIGESAFYYCKALTSMKMSANVSVIEELVFAYSGLTEVVLPEGVTTIRGGAFRNCEKLKSVTLPQTLTTIQVGSDFSTGGAFRGCGKLMSFTGGSPDLKIPNETFDSWSFSKGLYKKSEELVFRMDDAAILDCIVTGHGWEYLTPETQVTLMLTRQGKKFLKAYNEKRIDWGKVAMSVLSRINDKYTAKECNAVATLMVACCDRFTEERVQALYNALEPLKTAAKAKKTIQDCSALMKKLKLEAKVDDSLKGLAKVVAEQMLAVGKTQKEAEADLKNFYSLTPKDLPALKDLKGKKVDSIVFVWLLTAHEKLPVSKWGTPELEAAYEKPGVRPEAAAVVAELNHEAFMKALADLAKKNLGLTGRSKKMYLAYPICRYADEALMTELTKTAPKWSSSVSGNNAPPLLNFRRANMYSNTRAAMMFADKYKELDTYARLRGTDADTLRDQNLSDVGIDAQGGKTYDLGNQTVVARLQDDLSFLIELPTGKTAKSLPKKGADEALYAAAKADFSEMQKAVKKIYKNRNTVLFQDFLQAKERTAESWKAAYLDNALLRRAAKLLVWVQGKTTFTVTDTGIILADGSAYELTDKKIGLAHPMDMTAGELKAWQKYFTSKGLKQPFEQVWEPVVDPATIREDRYKGCMIPFYRFSGQSKHGIWVEDEDFHSVIYIIFEDCDAEVDRIDLARHEINMDDRFEVTSFSFKKYTRKTNHIAAYLDKITVFGRIANDDVSVADHIGSFTLAQITECIRIAQENNAVNVTAILLEHKNNNFADFDPMDEFTLDL